jgi:hypothetical protein
MPLLAELIVFYVAAAIKISLLRSCFSKACAGTGVRRSAGVLSVDRAYLLSWGFALSYPELSVRS